MPTGNSANSFFHIRWCPKRALPGVGQVLGMALLGSAPLDFLSHRLQHLDYNRGSLAELVDSSQRGLLIGVEQWFWQMLNPGPTTSFQELRTLKWWLGSDIDDFARGCLVELAAGVWCRLELKCSLKAKRCARFLCSFLAELCDSLLNY